MTQANQRVEGRASLDAAAVAVHRASSETSDAEISRAVDVLRSGGLVAFPTETVYGLGADAENNDAVDRIFAVKGRPTTHPLILHIASLAELGAWVSEVPHSARTLAEGFWPGPLTLVLRRSQRVPHSVTGGLETVAVRVPAHPVALRLLRSFGGALAAPSANRFGSVSPTTANHVELDLGSDVGLVLNGGACGVGVESTIVDLSGNSPAILRPGGVSREDLEAALGSPVSRVAAATPVRAPGSHASHYAPRARVVVVTHDALADEAQAQAAKGLSVGVLLPTGVTAPAVAGAKFLHAPANAVDFARNLYALLREFDRIGCEVVLVTLPDEAGLGAAIADRLQRAAGPRTRDASA